MGKSSHSYRSHLLAAGACALVALASAPAVRAQTAPATATDTSASVAPSKESITVRAQKRLIREKNSPSAVTELGQTQIQAAGVSASVTSLLRQAPSVNVYQQGLGDNAPEMSIRGLRGLEVASTLDGVPMQDLLAPGAFYLANNLVSPFTTNQIQGVSVYPGVAYPDKNTFGTIGGTVAYQSKRPSDDFYVDLIGSVGSFGAYKEGFEVNSGAFDSPLGTGDNAAKILLNYYNFQSQGFIQNTPNRENQMEFAFDKPYDDGLSKFQATVIYNTGTGYIENEPVPVVWLNKYGLYSNYPLSQDSAYQNDDYVTVILKDETYINDYLGVGGTVFYIHNNNLLNTYAGFGALAPGGSNTALTLMDNGVPVSPFINNPAGFGYADGNFGPNGSGGLYNGNPNVGQFYNPKGNPYNPAALYPAGSKDCPAWVVKEYGGQANSPCGLNDQIQVNSSNIYGSQVHATVTPDAIFGIQNTIKFGAMIAKETAPTTATYLGGDENTPMDAAHLDGFLSGGTQRTIYQAFVQDKIDFLDNSLHFTPGMTIEGTNSSDVQGLAFSPTRYATPASPYYDDSYYGPYSATKWDRDYLPFVNVSYDFDKIMPALSGVQIYGSFGDSALFAPTTDFGPSSATLTAKSSTGASFAPPPDASIVHMYEGGIKYDTAQWHFLIDYYYQKVDRDFGFFSYQSGPNNGESIFSNDGQRELKGYEAQAQYQITPNIQIFGNASYNMAHYLTTSLASVTISEDQYGLAQKGAPITGIPDWLATFGVDFDKKNLLTDNDAFHVRLQGQYTGHQATTDDLGALGSAVPVFQGVGGICSLQCPLLSNPNGPGKLSQAVSNAYNAYSVYTGQTTYDPNGGIAPNTVFSTDINYTLPTPQLPVLKNIMFDLNIQNIFDTRYWQYYYREVSPANCGYFTSGPFKGLQKNNYSCTPQFAAGMPGQPLGAFFTIKARF